MVRTAEAGSLPARCRCFPETRPRRGRTVIVALVGMAIALAVALGARPPAPPPAAAEATKPAPASTSSTTTGSAPPSSRPGPTRSTSKTRASTANRAPNSSPASSRTGTASCRSRGRSPAKAPARRPSSAAPLGGFSVELTAKAEEEGSATNPDLGTLCPGTFTVNSTTQVETLRFTKGAFLIYLPTGSGLACLQASRLFTNSSAPAASCPRPGS